jgi:hypothetical protein
LVGGGAETDEDIFYHEVIHELPLAHNNENATERFLACGSE